MRLVVFVDGLFFFDWVNVVFVLESVVGRGKQEQNQMNSSNF